MAILDRFTSIVKANINDLLDKAEDPAKMVDQYIRELAEDLAEVKKSTASVMAEEKRYLKLLEENEAEIEKYNDLARKALTMGEEEDARKFLAKKQELEANNVSLKTSYEYAHDNANKMREMHDKLVNDIQELNNRKAAIKAKAAVAKTQNKMSSMMSSSENGAKAIDAFNRMESKVDNMLEQSNAMIELNQPKIDSTEELAKRYSEAGNSTSVDIELEKLKEEMGL